MASPNNSRGNWVSVLYKIAHSPPLVTGVELESWTRGDVMPPLNFGTLFNSKLCLFSSLYGTYRRPRISSRSGCQPPPCNRKSLQPRSLLPPRQIEPNCSQIGHGEPRPHRGRGVDVPPQQCHLIHQCSWQCAVCCIAAQQRPKQAA